jgi:hypothetical protein
VEDLLGASYTGYCLAASTQKATYSRPNPTKISSPAEPTQVFIVTGREQRTAAKKGHLCPKPTKFIVANQVTNVTQNRLYLHQATPFSGDADTINKTHFFSPPAPFNISWYNVRDGSSIQWGIDIFSCYDVLRSFPHGCNINYEMCLQFVPSHQEVDYNKTNVNLKEWFF